MKIKEISAVSIQLHTKIILLLKQLTDKNIDFSMSDFSLVVESKNSILYGAFESEELIGILTLVLINIPTGKQLRIEDVVVDITQRGKGVGELLTRAAISRATKMKINKLSLTSNPSRVGANNLYQKLGFRLCNTNSYVLELEKNGEENE